MIDSTQQKAERMRALKKLVKKWRATQETKSKAAFLKSKNPELKAPAPKKKRD